MSEPADAVAQAREERARSLLDRDASALDDLMAAATTGAASAGDAPGACRAWLAVRRHAAMRLGAVGAWPARGALTERLAVHRELLAQAAARGEREAGAFGPEVRKAAAASLGLRVAVMGKGGVGKSVLCGTMARLLARRGRRVLAADLDTNPGLAFSLGLGLVEAGLPPEALEEHAGAAYGWQLASGLGRAEAIDRFASPGPDHVHYLGVGKICEEEHRMPRRSLTAVLQILGGLSDPGWDVIADMEAGTTSPYERYQSFAERLVIVVGPGWKTRQTARRLMAVVGDVPVTVVASRDVPGLGRDGQSVSEGPSLEGPVGPPRLRVPLDPAVAEAERAGLAPLDECPDSPVVRAISELVDLLLDDQVRQYA